MQFVEEPVSYLVSSIDLLTCFCIRNMALDSVRLTIMLQVTDNRARAA